MNAATTIDTAVRSDLAQLETEALVLAAYALAPERERKFVRIQRRIEELRRQLTAIRR